MANTAGGQCFARVGTCGRHRTYTASTPPAECDYKCDYPFVCPRNVGVQDFGKDKTGNECTARGCSNKLYFFSDWFSAGCGFRTLLFSSSDSLSVGEMQCQHTYKCTQELVNGQAAEKGKEAAGAYEMTLLLNKEQKTKAGAYESAQPLANDTTGAHDDVRTGVQGGECGQCIVL